MSGDEKRPEDAAQIECSRFENCNDNSVALSSILHESTVGASAVGVNARATGIVINNGISLLELDRLVEQRMERVYERVRKMAKDELLQLLSERRTRRELPAQTTSGGQSPLRIGLRWLEEPFPSLKDATSRRIIARIQYRKDDGGLWPESPGYEYAVVDTGSPLSMIPLRVARRLRVRLIGLNVRVGHGGTMQLADIAHVDVRIADAGGAHVDVSLRAFVVEGNLPMVLGVADLFERVNMVLGRNELYFEVA